MSFNKWLPWGFAFVWLIIRLTSAKLFFDEDYDRGRVLGVMTNLLFILLILFLSLVYSYKENPKTYRSFFSDVRMVLFPCAKYSVAVVIAMGIYYSSLSEELQNKRLADYTLIEQALDTPEKIAKIKSENPLLKDISKEKIIESSIERTDTFTSLKIILPSSLLILLIISFLYSLLAVFLFQKFLRIS